MVTIALICFLIFKEICELYLVYVLLKEKKDKSDASKLISDHVKKLNNIMFGNEKKIKEPPKHETRVDGSVLLVPMPDEVDADKEAHKW